MNLIRRILSIKKYKFMLLQLIKRDFKVRYRGSILGVLWSVLNPLLNMIVLSIVFGQVFKAVDNYKMYLLSGLLIFNFFSEGTNLGLTSVVSNFGLLTKVYFPKVVLPLSKVFSSSINFFMSMIAFFIISVFMGIEMWWGYIFIIYLVITLILFTSGISFILATLQVFMRDIQHLYSVLIVIWMYGTPIIYPIDVIPENYLFIYKVNPLYIFITFLREITLYNSIPQLSNFVLCALWGLGVFVLGAIVFVRSQNKFIYYT